MKTIKEQVMVEKEFFIAFDGKKFDNDVDCKSHEKLLNKKYNERFIKEIEQKEVVIPYINYENGTTSVIAYKPKNTDEIKVIEEYYKNHYDEYYGEICLTDMNKWICISMDCDRYYASYMGTLESVINQINSRLTILNEIISGKTNDKNTEKKDKNENI